MPRVRDYQWPFTAGQAVWIVQGSAQIRPPVFLPAVVVRPNNPDRSDRVCLLDTGGRRRSASGSNLVHRGFCPSCAQPGVVERGMLCCPSCGDALSDEPPPDRWIVWAYPAGDNVTARAGAHAMRTGCTWGEALYWRLNETHQAFVAMLAATKLTNTWYEEASKSSECYYAGHMPMVRLALLGDADAFVETWRAAGGPMRGTMDIIYDLAELGARMLQAAQDDDLDSLPQRPPLNITRPAEDAEPDAERSTPLDRWLDGQFGKAA